MKNFQGNGESLQLIAPAGGVVGGKLFKQGSLVGVVVADAAEGVQFTLKLKGVYNDVTKKAGEAWAIGDKLYFDEATGETSKDNTKTFVGYANSAQLAADVLGEVLLRQ